MHKPASTKSWRAAEKEGWHVDERGENELSVSFTFLVSSFFHLFIFAAFFFEDSKIITFISTQIPTDFLMKGWKQSGTALNMGDVILLKAITSARDFVADEQIPQWLETVGEHMDLNKQQMTRFDNTHISWIIWKNLTELCKNIHKPFSRQQNVISWLKSINSLLNRLQISAIKTFKRKQVSYVVAYS